MRMKFLVGLLLVCFATVVANAQEYGVEEEDVVVSDSTMRQVVNRIMRWHFKAGRVKKTIPIADVGIKREWLPDIENINFKVVSKNDALDYKDGVFLFDDINRVGEVYSINVGWGDFHCSAYGKTWKFREKAGKVSLWPTTQGWGHGCGGNGPPMVRGLKLGDVTPNELAGYEFFQKGTIRDIRLGISTREDLRIILGGTCEDPCEYDKNWRVWGHYFREGENQTQTSTSSDGTETETEFVLKREFVGKLRSLEFTPKKPISLLTVSFPSVFSKNQLHSVGDSWGVNGFEGAVHSKIDTYTDGYGLRYKVYDKETFDNRTSTSGATKEESRKGNLIGIEYEIPDVLEKKIFDSRIKRVTKK